MVITYSLAVSIAFFHILILELSMWEHVGVREFWSRL